MDVREQLHHLLDDFSDEELIGAEAWLLSVLHRREHSKRDDALDRLTRRGEAYRADVEKNWHAASTRIAQLAPTVSTIVPFG
jgi:hypothetical protein